jgi:hypothetical protein
MENVIDRYWRIRLTNLKKALEVNNFEVFIAENRTQAKDIVLEHILPKTGAKSVSRGGSITIIATGIWEAVKDNPDLEFIDPFEKVGSLGLCGVNTCSTLYLGVLQRSCPRYGGETL